MKISGNIVRGGDIFFGDLDFEQIISAIVPKGPAKKDQPWIYPGFIDLHVHGGAGGDMMEGEGAIRAMLRAHAKHGTTSLLTTTVTETFECLVKTFKDVQKVMSAPDADGASLLGVHLEGPFLSSQKLGAQPDRVREFSLDEVLKLHAIAPIRIITVAPESGISADDIQTLKKHNIVVQLGHSDATYEQVCDLLAAGAESVTHLFNAMSALHHRTPGMVGATLAHGQRAELIPDLIHVHPGAIKVALRSIPDLYFVTDATAAAAMPDGQYKLGPHAVYKCANGVRLADGTLAGSCLTMDNAFKNVRHLGLDEKDCARRFAAIQAQLIGQHDRGELKIGKRADFVVIDKQNNLQQVFIGGRSL